MLRRTYLGIDIAANSMRAVALHRGARTSALIGARSSGCSEEEISLSVREPNIRHADRFIARLQELLEPLAGKEDRIALSLPDAAGRILLTEVETPFKTRAEAVEILRWQLRSELPAELADIQLDYQLLARSESGLQRMVVALMDRRVLDQYQELVIDAGYQAVEIGFHSLNLYNFYRPRLDMGEDFALVDIEDGFLHLALFQEKNLIYHRFREVDEDPARVFQEINRSLVGFPGSPSVLRRLGVYLHCPWQDAAEVRDAVTSAFEKEPVNLDPHLERMTGGTLELDQARGLTLTAAIGAAEQMMRGRS